MFRLAFAPCCKLGLAFLAKVWGFLALLRLSAGLVRPVAGRLPLARGLDAVAGVLFLFMLWLIVAVS